MSMTTKERTANSVVQAEDAIIADLMETVRGLNGDNKSQQGLVEFLLKHAIAFMDEEDVSSSKGDSPRGFLCAVSAFGCMSLAQKAMEEWTRFDRERDEDTPEDPAPPEPPLVVKGKMPKRFLPAGHLDE